MMHKYDSMCFGAERPIQLCSERIKRVHIKAFMLYYEKQTL